MLRFLENDKRTSYNFFNNKKMKIYFDQHLKINDTIKSQTSTYYSTRLLRKLAMVLENRK